MITSLSTAIICSSNGLLRRNFQSPVLRWLQIPPATSHSSHKHEENLMKRHIDPAQIQQFLYSLEKLAIPKNRIITDQFKRFAYSVDASMYRLVPQVVILVKSTIEVQGVIKAAARFSLPITFRAAGTSLSGQAVTDSVLVKIVPSSWSAFSFPKGSETTGKLITLQPGLIGSKVNKILAPFERKLGPDPASIDSAMIGGIAANNSSGMCCGVSNSTYSTVKDIKMVFHDGTLLDTGSSESCSQFIDQHPEFIDKLSLLAKEVQDDSELTSLIREKFSIKCTSGFSLNSLIDFTPDQPIEILKHLLIGSEGTLGFISEITYSTVKDYRHKATSLLLFPTLQHACETANLLCNGQDPTSPREKFLVDAAELMDRPALCAASRYLQRSKSSLTPILSSLEGDAAALLIEAHAEDHEALHERISIASKAIERANIPLMQPLTFSEDEKHRNELWKVRKGLYPIVGGERPTNTTLLLEDVAVRPKKLASMSHDLKQMFSHYKYTDAVLFGHALDGNLHLVFSQSFDGEKEIERYAHLMEDLCSLVVTKYNGSLKAEHGTGRNIASFIPLEWGEKSTELMWQIKSLFDPNGILNPGVIINRDRSVHLKNLKSMPQTVPEIDKCLECGFCEAVCPSRELSLTPRQRISITREVTRQLSDPSLSPSKKLELQRRLDQEVMAYSVSGSCAADGMCGQRCPVGINTGSFVKALRDHKRLGNSTFSSYLVPNLPTNDKVSSNSRGSRKGLVIAEFIASNLSKVESAMRWSLRLSNFTHSIFRTTLYRALTGLMFKIGQKISPGLLPRWNEFMPTAAAAVSAPMSMSQTSNGHQKKKVVYYASCVSRFMGPAASDPEKDSIHQVTIRVLEKSGFQVIIPERLSATCCGCSFGSHGFSDVAEKMAAELWKVLEQASEQWRYPILIDTSPCNLFFKEVIEASADRLAIDETQKTLAFAAICEPFEFAHRYLKAALHWEKKFKLISIHSPCSSQILNLDARAHEIASLCAVQVNSTDISCCGMAGDRGLVVPELPEAALSGLKQQILSGCSDGYSTSRTCEIGLSLHSGVHFRSIMFLIDKCTSALPQEKEN